MKLLLVVLRNLSQLVLLTLTMFAALPSTAHEIRPAYLEITEDAAQNVHVLWKQPILGRLALPLAPNLSAGWLKPETSRQTFTDTFLILQWDIAPPHASLHGQQLTIVGLDKTITDTLVRINYSNGATVTRLVKPESPSLLLQQPGQSNLAVAEYFELGVTHIWTGIDHLLYIFGLMLLVSNRRTLIKTITAFTIAHSITLAAAALKLINVSPPQIEVVIALSIVYVAVEVVHLRQGRPGLAARYPWIIAFIFGLLHGLGFAGALAEVGLPKDAIPAALFLFNVGIEAGQLAFVLAVSLILAGLKYLWPRIEHWIPRLSPHVIGTLASFWCFERATHIF